MGCGASSNSGRDGASTPQQQQQLQQPSGVVIETKSLTQVLIVLSAPEPEKSAVMISLEAMCTEKVTSETGKKIVGTILPALQKIDPQETCQLASTAFSWLGDVAPPPFNTVLSVMGKIFFFAGNAQQNRRQAQCLAKRLLCLNDPLSRITRDDDHMLGDGNKLTIQRINALLDECHAHLTSFMPPPDISTDVLVDWVKMRVKQITTSQDAWEELHGTIDKLLQDLTFEHVVQSRIALGELKLQAQLDHEDMQQYLQKIDQKLDSLSEKTDSLTAMMGRMLRDKEFESLMVPATLVKLMKPVGEGGQGIVWEALLDNRPNIVAKQIRCTDETAAVATLREAKLLMGFRHPNIVQCYGVAVKEGHTYMLLERCVESLDRVVYQTVEATKGSQQVEGLSKSSVEATPSLWTVAAALSPAYDISCALSHIHGKHRVHRDVKTDNIMVKSNGEACLIDFASMKRDDETSAAAASNNTTHATVAMTGLQGTTVAYAAPELIRNPARVASSACDVYSFGMVLYEILSQQRAYEAELGTMSQFKLMGRIEDGLRPSLEPFKASDPELVALIQQCWADAPEDRPSSDVLKAQLEGLRRGKYGGSDEAWRAFLEKRWGAGKLAVSVPMTPLAGGGGSGGPPPPATVGAVVETSSLSASTCTMKCCEQFHKIVVASMNTDAAVPTAELLSHLFSERLGLRVPALRVKHFLSQLRNSSSSSGGKDDPPDAHLDKDHLNSTLCRLIRSVVCRPYQDACAAAGGSATISRADVKRIVLDLSGCSEKEASTTEKARDINDIIDDATHGSPRGMVSLDVYLGLMDTILSDTTTATAPSPAATTIVSSAPATVAGAPSLLHDMLYEIVPVLNPSVRLDVGSLDAEVVAKNGIQLHFTVLDASPGQLFRFSSASVGTADGNKLWKVTPALVPKKLVDNAGGIHGARCHLWDDCGAHVNQQWVITKASVSPKAAALYGDAIFIVRTAAGRESCAWSYAPNSGTTGTQLTLMDISLLGALGSDQPALWFKFVRRPQLNANSDDTRRELVGSSSTVPAASSSAPPPSYVEIASSSDPTLRLAVVHGVHDGAVFEMQRVDPLAPSQPCRHFAARELPDDGGWQFFSRVAPFAIVDNAGAPDRACHLWTSVGPGHPNQTWYLQPCESSSSSSNGTHRDFMVHSKLNRCSVWTLEHDGASPPPMLLNVMVDKDVCNGTYESTLPSRFRFHFIPVATDGGPLGAASGDGIVPMSLTAHEALFRHPAVLPLVHGAVYEITPNDNMNLRVDVPGGECHDGAPIQIWDAYVTFGAQTFIALQHASDGSWCFVPTCAVSTLSSACCVDAGSAVGSDVCKLLPLLLTNKKKTKKAAKKEEDDEGDGDTLMDHVPPSGRWWVQPTAAASVPQQSSFYVRSVSNPLHVWSLSLDPHGSLTRQTSLCTRQRYEPNMCQSFKFSRVEDISILPKTQPRHVAAFVDAALNRKRN